MSKIFTLIIIISLIIQVGFSFYYSNEIINQNSELDQYQTKVNSLKLDMESIEKNLADLSSISKISQSTSSASTPINQTLKIISQWFKDTDFYWHHLSLPLLSSLLDFFTGKLSRALTSKKKPLIKPTN